MTVEKERKYLWIYVNGARQLGQSEPDLIWHKINDEQTLADGFFCCCRCRLLAATVAGLSI